MKSIYLGLGSNLGDREANLTEAVRRLRSAGLALTRISSVYETRPMYLADQPMFLNCVAETQGDVFPRHLLKRLKTIEREMGRKRTTKNAARPIDIDILFFGRFVIQSAELVVPHPAIAERRFVLEPLAEIAPDLRHPVLKRTIRELLQAVSPAGVKRTAFQIALDEPV